MYKRKLETRLSSVESRYSYSVGSPTIHGNGDEDGLRENVSARGFTQLRLSASPLLIAVEFTRGFELKASSGAGSELAAKPHDPPAGCSRSFTTGSQPDVSFPLIISGKNFSLSPAVERRKFRCYSPRQLSQRNDPGKHCLWRAKYPLPANRRWNGTGITTTTGRLIDIYPRRNRQEKRHLPTNACVDVAWNFPNSRRRMKRRPSLEPLKGENVPERGRVRGTAGLPLPWIIRVHFENVGEVRGPSERSEEGAGRAAGHA